MTVCNGCGGCCAPVVLLYTQMDARRAFPGDGPGQMTPDIRRWVLEDLTPIPRSEGLRHTNAEKGGVTVWRDERSGETMTTHTFYYECRHYDPATRECAIYDDRPSPCRGYPWFGRAPDPTLVIPAECSFNIDVGRVPVEIGATR